MPARRRPRLGLQRLIPTPSSRAVMRVGEEVPSAFPTERVWRSVRRLYKHGLHPAIALHVRYRGEVVCDRTLGHVQHDPGEPPGPIVTPDTLFNLFSASKIVTAAVIHALVDDGTLDLDLPVAHWLPGFAQQGKHGILLRHLLSHTAGIQEMPAGMDLRQMLRAGRIDLEPLLAMPALAPPGRQNAYHAMSSWFLLEGVVEAATGKGLRDLLRTHIREPMGLPNLDYGVPEARLGEVARHAVTGPPVPSFMSDIFKRSIGLGFTDAITISNDPDFLTATLPSANVVATPRETTAFMQMLLDGGVYGGERILSPEAVRRLTTRATPVRIDRIMQMPMAYGMGVMMGGDAFSLYGLGTGGAFGHLGLSTVVVYADPRRELAVAFLNTGKPMMAHGMLTWYAVLQQIALSVPRAR